MSTQAQVGEDAMLELDADELDTLFWTLFYSRCVWNQKIF